MRDGQRIRLREPRQSDYEFLVELFSEEDVLRFIARGRRDHARELIRHMCEGAPPSLDKRYWIGEQQEDSRQVGYVSALRYSTPRVEIVFAVSSHFRKLGYGHELVTSLVGELTNTSHVQDIAAKVDYHNSPSQRTLVKAGFIASNPLGIYEKTVSRCAPR